jgi:hypothetical protein
MLSFFSARWRVTWIGRTDHEPIREEHLLYKAMVLIVLSHSDKHPISIQISAILLW